MVMSRVWRRRAHAQGTRRLVELVGMAAMLTVGAAAAHAADSERTFEVYGFAQADFTQDFKRVDPAWDDALRPSKIPTTEGQFGGNGQTSFAIKQSRLGFKGTMPTGTSSPLNFKLEIDLFGVGVDAGQTTLRLRHAYGEWGPFLAGQTNSNFMDIDIFPNTVEYWGPTGMVFFRNVQLRWTPMTGANTFAIAIEKPGNDVDAGEIRTLDPNLGNNIKSDEEFPDITASYRINRDWGHLQVAGIVRRVGFETLGTPDNAPTGHDAGWGINVTSSLKLPSLGEGDKLLVGVVYGDGIASYMNDGGMDLAPEGTPPNNLSPKAVPLTGVSLYLDHYWNKSYSSSIGYSFTEVDNTNFQSPDAYHRGDYASANLLYYPGENMLVGAELIWGQREDNDGATGNDIRLQVTFKYNFSTKL
jgi:hypothetical protein